MKLSIATCYVPVDADIRSNVRFVLRQMHAAKGGAGSVGVVHLTRID